MLTGINMQKWTRACNYSANEPLGVEELHMCETLDSMVRLNRWECAPTLTASTCTSRQHSPMVGKQHKLIARSVNHELATSRSLRIVWATQKAVCSSALAKHGDLCVEVYSEICITSEERVIRQHTVCRYCAASSEACVGLGSTNSWPFM